MELTIHSDVFSIMNLWWCLTKVTHCDHQCCSDFFRLLFHCTNYLSSAHTSKVEGRMLCWMCTITYKRVLAKNRHKSRQDKLQRSSREGGGSLQNTPLSSSNNTPNKSTPTTITPSSNSNKLPSTTLTSTEKLPKSRDHKSKDLHHHHHHHHRSSSHGQKDKHHERHRKREHGHDRKEKAKEGEKKDSSQKDRESNKLKNEDSGKGLVTDLA